MSNALRIFVFGLFVSVASCGKPSPCDACGEGTLCDTASGKCVARTGGTGGGSGGGGPSACSPACSGTRPVCDETTNPQNPHCVGCMRDTDCASGMCRLSSQTCASSTGGGAGGGGGSSAGGGSGGGGDTGGGGDAGGDAGGGNVGGSGSSGTGGGGASGTGGGTGTGGGGSVAVCPGGSPTYVTTPDAGYQAGQFIGTGSCAPQDAGVGGTCVPSCNEGFQCQGGVCVLNGGQGPVQVTLRWNSLEDLDLHVLEPLPNGGTCEIYYGDTNRPGDPSSCGARGWLDLDSEPGCSYDYVDTENIIYSPQSPAPCGTYTVWVNHYENCNASLQVVPFELEVRFAGMSVGVCGAFVPTDPDWDNGNADQSRFMMTFTVP